MIKLKNYVIDNRDFIRALNDLSGCKLKFATSLKIAKVLREIQDIKILLDEKKKEIISNAGVSADENGYLKYDAIENIETKKKLISDIELLLSEEIELDSAKIPSSDLSEIEIEANKLAILYPVLDI